MQTSIAANEIVISKFRSNSEITRIVELAMAAGLWSDLHIRESPDGSGPEIGISWPSEALGPAPLAAMSCLVAEVEGISPEKMLQDWMRRTPAWSELVD
jgi:hypothetical protein